MTCRTCKFLDVAPDKSGRRVPRKTKAYRCLVEIPGPVVPACIDENIARFRSTRRYMEPDEGAGCPLWEALPQEDGR